MVVAVRVEGKRRDAVREQSSRGSDSRGAVPQHELRGLGGAPELVVVACGRRRSGAAEEGGGWRGGRRGGGRGGGCGGHAWFAAVWEFGPLGQVRAFEDALPNAREGAGFKQAGGRVDRGFRVSSFNSAGKKIYCSHRRVIF